MAAPLTCRTPWKQRWRSESEALVQMRHTKATSKYNKKLRSRLNVYVCTCGGWHVGHNRFAHARDRKSKVRH